MLKVTTPKKKKSFVWIPVAIVSVAAHVGFFIMANGWAETKERVVYEPSKVEFRTIAPKPLPEPEPEVRPEPKPEPKAEPKPKIVKKRNTPKPNTSKPEPPAPKAEPAKPVFGVTADSVSSSKSSVVIRVGNTLAKGMEKKVTPVKAVKSLPKEQPKVVAAPKKTKIKPVPVYELSTAPSFKKKYEPKYPESAKRDGIEGTVQLEVLIDAKGRVRKVRVIKTPGHGLEKAAIAALSKSRFNPGIMSGKAVAVKIKIPYRFVLHA